MENLGRLSATLSMAFDALTTTIKNGSRCQDTLQTISFITVAFVVCTAGLIGISTSMGRLVALLALNHTVVHSNLVNTILQAWLVPSLPDNVQALMESGHINLLLSIELLAIAVFAALMAWYTSPKKPSSTGKPKRLVQVVLLLVATHLVVHSQFAATLMQIQLLPRLPIKTQALVESGSVSLQLSVELLTMALIMALLAWSNSTSAPVIIEQDPVRNVSDDVNDLLVCPTGKGWYQGAAKRGLSQDILGISASPSEQEVRHGFRMKAWRYHPDQPCGDTDIFKMCNKAKEDLVRMPESKLYLDL